jgi:hypothetical protein
MSDETLISGSRSVQMYIAQADRRYEKPPARARMAAGHVGPLGVHLREFDLSARQPLLGRGQQPPYCLRPIAFDRIAVIVHAIAVQDAEVALRAGIAPLGGLKQPFLQSVAPDPWLSRRHG